MSETADHGVAFWQAGFVNGPQFCCAVYGEDISDDEAAKNCALAIKYYFSRNGLRLSPDLTHTDIAVATSLPIEARQYAKTYATWGKIGEYGVGLFLLLDGSDLNNQLFVEKSLHTDSFGIGKI